METNIVEVENLVQQTEERWVNALARGMKHYLETYPDTQYVNVLFTDLNGCFRGKRIPVADLSKLKKGCYFPTSVFAMDILGDVMEKAGLGQDMGEPDRNCIPVPGTLTPSAADPQSIVQVQLTMANEGDAPFDVEPRNVLSRLWQQLRQHGLFPAVVVELEFYLLDHERDTEGYLQPSCAPGTNDHNAQSQVYSINNLSHFADVLCGIDELARLQLVSADGAAAETSPSRFEINLHHTDNVLDACDDALALKRLVRLMTEKHEIHATFMAKPCEEHTGSGIYTHIDMLNNRGENVLMDGDGGDSVLLKCTLAGIIDLIPALMALLAPNVSSYRRFRPGMYVPTQASWGHNNRTVALRVPCGERQNHRVEYRVVGADANPYLMIAAIFTGILRGLDNPQLPLQEKTRGNGLKQEGLPFPIRQNDALQGFMQNDHPHERLGEHFCHVFHACKYDGLLQFERFITETGVEWMLKNA